MHLAHQGHEGLGGVLSLFQMKLHSFAGFHPLSAPHSTFPEHFFSWSGLPSPVGPGIESLRKALVSSATPPLSEPLGSPRNHSDRPSTSSPLPSSQHLTKMMSVKPPWPFEALRVATSSLLWSKNAWTRGNFPRSHTRRDSVGT
jgi:hypothetical protein